MPAAISAFFGFRARTPAMSSYDTLTLEKPAASNHPISSRSSHPTSVPQPVLGVGVIVLPDLTPLRLQLVIEPAGDHLIPHLLRDLVDRLKDGRSTFGFQH